MSSQVVSQSSFKNEPCGVEGCRATRYQWDYERGFAICRNGHEHPELRMQVAAEDLFESTRGDRSTRKRERQVFEKVQLSGNEAFELHILCWQLILRKQVWWLIHDRGLPAHIESLVRDLWALRLNAMTTRLRSDGLVATSESDTESRPVYSSQGFSTTSDDGDSDANAQQPIHSQSRSTNFGNTSPQLVDTVAMCYVACFLLRLPINLGDFLDWVQNGYMIYYRAILALPRDMKDRLPSQEQSRFDPAVLLTPVILQKAVSTLCLGFQHEMKLRLPPLNFPVHLLRLISALRIPIEVYNSVEMLSSLTDLDFRYPTTKRKRYRITDYPEFQLLGLIVIATKTLYPFDDERRYPLRSDEPATMVMDWETWAWTCQQEPHGEYNPTTDGSSSSRKVSRGLPYRAGMKLEEIDMLEMSEDNMDAYLDFYAEAFGQVEVRTRDRDTEFRQYLLDLFPVKRQVLSDHSTGELEPAPHPVGSALPVDALHTVISALKVRRAISAEDATDAKTTILRPGHGYKRYRGVQELSGTAELFYTEVARAGGVDLDALVRAVYLAERRLEIWAEGQRRKERAEAGGHSDSDTSIGRGKGRGRYTRMNHAGKSHGKEKVS